MPTKKTAADRQEALAAKIAKASIQGSAAGEQAAKAKTRKPTRKGSGPMGRPVSCYLHDIEQETINNLLDKLGAAAGANKSHLLRAGIHALGRMKKSELSALVEEVQSTDGRRR